MRNDKIFSLYEYIGGNIMKVLKAIGRFFAKIGRWIADTAWVQPLLIVGGIFALIFSIPYIVDGVQSMFKNDESAAEAYYGKYKVSWNGVESSSENSGVDKLFKYIMNPDDAANADYREKYGDKFFVAFVSEGCPDCEQNYYGLKTAQANWGKSGSEFDFEDLGKEKESFKIASVYVDTKDSNEELYFSNYISGNKNSVRYNDFFEDASHLQSPFVDNLDNPSENYYSSIYSENNDFTTPTLMLIDLSEDQPSYTTEFGVSEIVFKYSGRDGTTSNYDLARTIWDCWNHIGKFSADYKA
jgi:hypothetical protein